MVFSPPVLISFMHFSIRRQVLDKETTVNSPPSLNALILLKGRCHEIFDFRFFHASASHKPLNIPLGLLRVFSTIRRDICRSRCNTFVDTGGKWKKSSTRKVLIVLFGHLWVVELIYRYSFFSSSL